MGPDAIVESMKEHGYFNKTGFTSLLLLHFIIPLDLVL